MAEQQQQPTPTEQQQYPYTLAQQPPQSYDPNQQQAAASYDPSYAAYYASYYQQQQQHYDPNAHSQQQPHYDPNAHSQQQPQQYYDYSQAYPHHQFQAPQIHSQQPDPAYNQYRSHYPEGHIGSRRGGGSPFRGGGRRGGGRGRGRGRGGGMNPNKSTPAIPVTPPPPVIKIWCEICRVECNSLEILQQHKNGKRHKKTVQGYEEMQKQQKLVAEHQANLMPGGTAHPDEYQQANAMPAYQQAIVMPTVHTSGYQQENTMVSAMHSISVVGNVPSMAEQERVMPVSENITTAQAASTQMTEPVKVSETNSSSVQVDDPDKSNNVELEQKGKAATTEGTTELSKSDNHNQTNAKQRGMKRKAAKHIRSGKWPKRAEQRNIPEPHRICTVCNVTCESQVAFDAHIAGRKHTIKLRKFQQHGAVFGPITVYVPPNQPTAYPPNRPEPLYFGLSSYQMVGQVTYTIDGGHHGNIVNQDAPLVFAQKEKNGMGNSVGINEANSTVAEPPALDFESKEESIPEMENNVDNNAANCAAQESEPNEGDNMPANEKNQKTADICKVEVVAGSESKDNFIPGTGDAACVKENVS